MESKKDSTSFRITGPQAILKGEIKNGNTLFNVSCTSP